MLLTSMGNRILRMKGKGTQIPAWKSLLEGFHGGEGMGTVTAAKELCPPAESSSPRMSSLLLSSWGCSEEILALHWKLGQKSQRFSAVNKLNDQGVNSPQQHFLSITYLPGVENTQIIRPLVPAQKLVI